MIIKKLLSVFALFASIALFADFDLKSTPSTEVVKKGANIVFEATDIPEGSRFEIKLNSKSVQRGAATEKKFDYTMEEPSWLVVAIEAPKQNPSDRNEKAAKKELGFIASPELITAATTKPADMDKFWAAQKKIVEKFPANKPDLEFVREYPASEGKHAVELYKFKIKVDNGADASCEGGTADGYFAIPTDVKGKIPAVVTFYGAGSYGADMRDALYYAQDGAIGISMNPHSIPTDLVKQEREDFIKNKVHGGEGKNYNKRGVTDAPEKIKAKKAGASEEINPEKVYFTGMFRRCYQVLRMAMARPEWDGKNLAVRGFSQGGAQTIAAAYLCPKVSVMTPLCPAMCDNGAQTIGRRSGWPDWVNNPQTPEEIVNVGKYFDPALMAQTIKANMYVGIGMLDNTCTPTAVSAMYNAFAGKKKYLYMQGIGHGWNKEWEKSEREFILKNVGLAK